MNNFEFEKIKSNSSVSIDIPVDSLKYNAIENPLIIGKNTIAYQGFYDRLTAIIKSLYQKYSLLNIEQLLVLFGALKGGYFVMHNLSPDYRLDKSPTISVEHDFNSWHSLNEDFIYHDNYIDDQPNYSHNEVYLLAKKIGFPTEFEL